MNEPTPTGRIATWFSQWRLPLRKYLIRKGSVSNPDLDDVAQEVFLRLMRYDRTELIENPQAYLFKMASNVAAEWAIRGRERRLRDAQLYAQSSTGEAYEAQSASLELQEEIERALLTLTTQQRAVLRLQFYEGLSRKDIAAHLQMTERSVKRALMKGYQGLRLQLDLDLLQGGPDGGQ